MLFVKHIWIPHTEVTRILLHRSMSKVLKKIRCICFHSSLQYQQCVSFPLGLINFCYPSWIPPSNLQCLVRQSKSRPPVLCIPSSRSTTRGHGHDHSNITVFYGSNICLRIDSFNPPKYPVGLILPHLYCTIEETIGSSQN